MKGGSARQQYLEASLFEGFVSNGGWGKCYHTKFHELSLHVSCVDEAIDTVARAFSSGIPYLKDEKGELSQDSPLIDFLLEPNKNQNFKEFAKDFVRNLYASGYSYLLPTSQSDSNIRRIDKLNSESRPELIVLNTDYIEYMQKEWFGLIDNRNKFKYSINSSEIIYEYTDVIPFWDKVQDPKNYRLGISRLVSLKDEITNIITANRAKTNKIENSGKFLVTQARKNANANFGSQLDQPVNIENPSYTQRNLLEDRLTQTGLAKDKSITILKEEMQAINVMESIQGYSYDNEVKEDKRTVKNNFGIPRELQNIGDDASKYENRKEAYLELFTLNILPLADNFTESIQNYYDPNNKKKLILDYTHHPAFEINEGKAEIRLKSEIETLITLYEKEIISKDELTKKLKNEGII